MRLMAAWVCKLTRPGIRTWLASSTRVPGTKAVPRLAGGQEGDNTAIVHGNGMALSRQSVPRGDPAGVDQQIDVLGHDLHLS